MLPLIQCPPNTTVQTVEIAPAVRPRAAVLRDCVLVVVAGEVVMVPRRSAFVHTDGRITLPVEDDLAATGR